MIFREIEIGKLTKSIDGFPVVGSGGFPFGIKCSYMLPLNSCRKSLDNGVCWPNPLINTCAIVSLCRSIHRVLLVRARSKIESSAIQSVKVDVVDARFRKSKDLAMEVDSFFVLAPNSIGRSPTRFRQGYRPQVLVNLFNIANVNDRNIALGQRNGKRSVSVVDQWSRLVTAWPTLLQPPSFRPLALRANGRVKCVGIHSSLPFISKYTCSNYIRLAV